MDKHIGEAPIAASESHAPRLKRVGSVIASVAALGIGIAVFGGRFDEAASQLVIEVYKDPACGCCSQWVEHLREEGFVVRATDTTELPAFKASHAVPRQLQSCHTALVDGYVIEGHVPAADVQRLLKERPAIAGLAVAGMPIGSPGMEIEGVQAQPYEVIAFESDGGARVFARHGS